MGGPSIYLGQSLAALAAESYLPIIQLVIQHMNQFNYCVVPTASFPSFYYLAFPINASHEVPSIENLPQLAQPTNFIPQSVPSSGLELTREDLEAAGYEQKKRVWSAEQDQRLLELVNAQGVAWKDIESAMPDRTEKMCYSRYRRILGEARQRWAPEEERRLIGLVDNRGENWKQFTSQFPHRTWKQLRDKYINYLRPDIKKDDWSVEEDQQILELIARQGTKWKAIQQEMPHRTDNQIKNRYYGRLKLLLKKKSRRRP